MKITRASVFLLGFAVVFFIASYLLESTSQRAAEELQRDFVAKNGFSISERAYDWTYWDVGSIAFLVFGASAAVAAARLAR